MSGSRLATRKLPALRARTGLPIVHAKAYTGALMLFLEDGQCVGVDLQTGWLTRDPRAKWDSTREQSSLARRLAAFKRARALADRERAR